MYKQKTLPLLMLMAWCILPIVVLFILSFALNWKYPAVLPQRFTTDHWNSFLFHNDGLQQSAINSLSIALFVAFLSTVLGFAASRWIAYNKYKKSFLLLAYFPFALSPVIFAICLKFYFLKSGLAGNITGVILAQLIITFPYSTIFFTSFWNNTVKEYEQLSFTLGSTVVTSYRKIIFPLAKSFLVTCFFQCFIISWFEYGLTNIIGYGKVQTLTIKVFQFISEANIFYAALSSCLLILPPVVLLWLNKKFIIHQTR